MLRTTPNISLPLLRFLRSVLLRYNLMHGIVIPIRAKSH